MKKYLAEFFNKINHFTGETKAKQKRKNEKKKKRKEWKGKSETYTIAMPLSSA